MSEPELDSSYQIVDHGDDMAEPIEEDDDNNMDQEPEPQDDSLHCFTGHSGDAL